MNNLEIESFLNNITNHQVVTDLYALSGFFEQATYSQSFHASDQLAAAIFLTPSGTEVFESLDDGHNLNDLKLSLFGHFFWKDLLIDHERTDPEILRKEFARLLGRGEVKLPHRFGRELHDRYFNLFPDAQRQSLSPSESQLLLNDSTVGIYQRGRLISGPLGLIYSTKHRHCPPNLSPPIAHCNEPGCNILHTVTLTPPPIDLGGLSHSGRRIPP